MKVFFKQFPQIGLIIALLLMLTALSSSAQEATAEANPTENPTTGVEVTEAPSEVTGTSLAPTETAEATLIATVTAEITEAPTVTTAAPEVTNEASSEFAPEPPFSLLVREMFDNGDASPWLGSIAWNFVASENGQALQVTNSNDALELQKGAFYNLAVQARFLSDTGAAILSIRHSSLGQYSAVLQNNGTVELYRSDVLLATATVAASSTGQWRTLRISAVDSLLRVSVDNQEVIVFADSTTLPSGTITIGANFTNLETANTLLVDDFMLWVPWDELANYASPTPYLALTTPAPVTAAPEVTAEITLSPTEIAAEGKDYSPFPPPSAEEIAQAEANLASTLGNDDFGGQLINSLPYYATDNTIGDTLQVNETKPACGYGLANTVWFNFTPATTASYRLATVGSSFDTILAIYTGSDLTTLTRIACNDDLSLKSLNSQITVNLTSGTSYYIQIGGFNGRYGNYSFSLEQLGSATPSVPALVSPANGAKTNNVNTELDWNSVLNVYRYELQLATNTSFTANLQTAYVLAPDTSYVLPTLPDTTGTVYYWRLRAINASGSASAFSASRNFTLDTFAPLAPTLSTPADTSIISNSRPTLTWTAVTGATSYLIEFDDDSGFGSPILSDQIVNTNSYTFPTPIRQGTYYWRVQARDAALNVSGESAIQSFTVNILTVPANNGVIFTSTSGGTAAPVLRWTPVLGVSSYTLKIYDGLDFGANQIRLEPSLSGSNYTVTPPLPEGIYYWQVIPTGLAQISDVYSSFIISPPALAAPVLDLPLNGNRINDTSPDLSWLTVNNAILYDVQFATNSTFTANVQTLSTATNSISLPTLADSAGTTYYWRVRTVNGYAVAGAYSAARTFVLDTTAPTAPNLNNPAEALTLSNSRPTFNWAAVTGATSYILEVSDTIAFAAPLIAEALPTTTSFTLTTSIPQGTYYWRVRAVDAAGNVSNDSTVRSFNINILLRPADNTVIITNAPTVPVVLSWGSVIGATTYTVVLDNDTISGNGNISSQDVGTVTSYTVPALAAGIYYWQVRPTLFEPTNAVYRTFTISPTPPVAPTLLSPANASVSNNTIPDLTWSSVGTAISYEVQWATNAAFTANFDSELVPSVFTNYILPTLPNTNGTVYYWRVRSLNAFNVGGAFSAVRSFTLDTTAPTAPNLTAPLNNAISSNSRQSLTWAAVAGANGYRVDISNLADFSDNLLIDAEVTTASYTPPASLPQGIYYWRVQARDAAINIGQESTVRVFTINILTTPANNAVIFTATTTASPVLRWAAVSGATGYSVQVDDDTDFSNDLILEDNNLPSTITSYTASSLNQGVYYWRVRPLGINPPDNTIYNRLVISPRALAAPVLVSPINAAKTNDTTPNLDWDLVGTAAQYELQWATNSAFTQNFQNTFVTDPLGNLDLPSLSNTAGTVYYWRIRAINSLGIPGAWSVTRNFTLDTVAPNVPNLLAPADNSQSTVNPIAFKWAAATGAFRYEFRYGTENPPTITVTNLATTRFTPSSPLLAQNYYWQVRAIDAAGNASAWSGMRVVKISSANTAAPIPNRFTTSTPSLFWTPVSWTSAGGYYQLHVDNNANFVSPEFVNNNVVTGSQSLTLSALANGTWYWRVRACTAANACGAWSTTGVFSIEAP